VELVHALSEGRYVMDVSSNVKPEGWEPRRYWQGQVQPPRSIVRLSGTYVRIYAPWDRSRASWTLDAVEAV
jgi:hypothetical protein